MCAVLPGFLDRSVDRGLASLTLALRDRTTIARHDVDSPAEVGPTAQLAAVTALLDRHPAIRTTLIGHCYGAYLALLAAAADQRITDVVAIMPTRCFIWPQDYDPARDTWRAHGERSFMRQHDGELREFRVPYSVVEDARHHDLPAALRGLRQPILFIAGQQDELIGVEPVRRLHAECGSIAKSLAVLPVQHDYRERPEQVELVNRTVLDWIFTPVP